MSITTIAEYRAYTGDTTTLDPAVQLALDDAQEMIETFLGRLLDRIERTEQCLIYSANRIYPLATPVVACSAGTIVNSGYAIEGISPDGEPFSSFDRVSEYVYATVTYIGGFTTAAAPSALKRAVALLAQASGTSTTGAGAYPVGATSVSLGDASVSFEAAIGSAGSAEIDSLVPGLSMKIKRWRRRV